MNVITQGLTFRDYFFHSLTVDPVWIVIWAVAAGFIGMVSHWFKRNVKDKDDVSFLDWFVFSKLKSTLIAIGTMALGVISTIMPMEVAQLGLYQALVLGFTMGYAADSAFNGSDKVLK